MPYLTGSCAHFGRELRVIWQRVEAYFGGELGLFWRRVGPILAETCLIWLGDVPYLDGGLA